MVDRLRDLQSGTPDIEASAMVSGTAHHGLLPAAASKRLRIGYVGRYVVASERIANELGRGTLTGASSTVAT